MSLDGKSWLLIDKGKFSFLYPDGLVTDADGMVKMDLMYGMIRPASESDSGEDSQVSISACFFDENYQQEPGLYADGHYESVPACGGGGALSDVPFIAEPENGTVSVDPMALKTAEQFGQADRYQIIAPVVAGDDYKIEGEYYIYNPSDEKLYGPYQPSEVAAFYMLPKSMGYEAPYGMLQKAGSPFWSKDKSTGEYTLFSLDGSESESGFTGALITDPFSIGAFKKDRFYLYDQDLKPLYDGEFEAGALPIDQKAPVQVDGVWKLIDLNPDHENTDQKSKTAGQNKEVPKKQSLLAEMKGTYTDLYSFDSILEIDENGNLHGREIGGYSDESAPEYQNGTFYEFDYTGRFEIISESDSGWPARVRLTNFSLTCPAGTEEITDNTRYIYQDGKAYHLGDNSVFLVYKPGTSFTDLSQDVVDLVYPDAAGTGKSDRFILVQEDDHRRICMKQD